MIINPYVFATLSLSFLTSATSITSSITIPGTAAENDIAVLVFADADSGVGTVSGWTNVAYSVDGAQNDVGVYYKVLGPSDPGGTVSLNPTNPNAAAILVFRPTRAATVSANTWNAPGAISGNPPSQTVSASGQTTPLIVIGVMYSNTGGSGSITFSTASPAFDATVAPGAHGNCYLRVGYKLYTASPANHSIDMNDEGNKNSLMSGYLQAA